MERRIALALDGVTRAFAAMTVELVFTSAEDNCACLVRGEDGACFVLKIAWGRRAGMLKGEWASLGQLASLAPGCAPWPVMTGGDGDCCWLLREYIKGQTLREWVEARGGIPAKEAEGAALCLARLIRSVHRAGLVCRDIKPENLVRTGEGRFVLIDAGTVRRPSADKPRDTVLYATEGFAAPEQFGFHQSDARADVYALGVTLCYLFTGATDEKALGRAVPRGVRRVIKRSMAFSPRARYQGMDKVVRALAGGRRRLTAFLSVLAVALCAAGVLAGMALHARVPVASDFHSLKAAIDRIPEGGSGKVRIEGVIEAEDKVRIWKRSVTLLGDGVITNLDPQMATVQVYEKSEIVLQDFVTIRNTGEENALVLQGGTLLMTGGAIERTGEGIEGETSGALLLMSGASAYVSGGHIYVRRDSGSVMGVNAAEGTVFRFTGGRIDAMGDGVIGVLVGKGARFQMEGGMINAVARGGSGYAVNNYGFGVIEYLGGEMLLNGLMTVPLEISRTTVRNYDELITAIAKRSSDGRLLVDGTIRVPEGIRINGGRQIDIMAGENAVLSASGDYLFMVDMGSELILRGLALEGTPRINNQGFLEMQGMNIQVEGYGTFIDNVGGTARVLYSNTAKLEGGAMLMNGKGAAAIVTADVTTGAAAAYINEGSLTLRQGSIDLTGTGGVWVNDGVGGQTEFDRTVLKRGGVKIQAEDG